MKCFVQRLHVAASDCLRACAVLRLFVFYCCDASLASLLRAASFFLNNECRSLLRALFCDRLRS